MLRVEPEQVCLISPTSWHAAYSTSADGAPLLAEQGTFETRIERPDGTDFEAQISYSVAQWEGRRLLFNVCRALSYGK